MGQEHLTAPIRALEDLLVLVVAPTLSKNDEREALWDDELRGARDVGMTPVLIVPRGRDPYWPELREWDGLRIHTIPEVLELC